MTEDEFRADLLTTAASRSEVQSCGLREAFVTEALERLREAGEVPEGEPCPETITGQHGRKLEIDAWADDDADGSLHLFIALYGGAPESNSTLSLTEARDQGFNRLLGVYEQSREGWLTANIEESRPLWALARRIQVASRPTALRLHVVSDRAVNERLREIAGDETREKVPVTFQIWDISRLKRIHDAGSVRDDLVVDFAGLAGGGLPILPASVGSGDYDAYLAVLPGETLADIYIQHGSRLLEGNVRTFLGRSSNVNKGIAHTVTKYPQKFFAYNNGVAATASAVTTSRGSGGDLVVTSATDLQIVNGAQTTASLAMARRENNLTPGSVFVPMKLSVVPPDIAGELIPNISRFANSQNGVRPSDFFANHPFHRRMEEASRRILAPATGGSQVQTHWYYERARGQYLNDQVGMNSAQRNRFLLVNPRRQVTTKTDLAKAVCCFDLEPDVACKGAEKAFIAFAERITKVWEEEVNRATYGDDWFKAAIARIILFRAAESIVSKAPWYEGGYRAQIVAYSCTRLSGLAQELGSGLNYLKIWGQQVVGPVLEEQISFIGEQMSKVLRSPPRAGQNISEWAKQQACRKTALETRVKIVADFEEWVSSGGEQRSTEREARRTRRVHDALEVLKEVIEHDASYWNSVRDFGRSRNILTPEDEKALVPACQIPKKIPTERQAACLMLLVDKALDAGWSGGAEK
jgi:hypothetical protein